MQDVWVLSRCGRDFTIVMGVFTCDQLAIQHTVAIGVPQTDRWEPPREGRRYWQLETELYTYTIEQHVLHDAPMRHN